MQPTEPIHPANVEEIARTAGEAGAQVLRGPLRYPSSTGGWQLGDTDLSEFLARYRDQDLVVVVATRGEAEDPACVCGLCGFALGETRQCPRCKLVDAEIAAAIEARRQEREALLREVKRILSEDGS